MNNAMWVAVTEVKEACKGKKSLLQKVKAAMVITKHHWMVTNESDRFQAAIAGVMLESNDKEKLRLEMEIKALKTLNAVLSGVTVDMSTLKVPSKPLKLMEIWGGIK